MKTTDALHRYYNMSQTEARNLVIDLKSALDECHNPGDGIHIHSYPNGMSINVDPLMKIP